MKLSAGRLIRYVIMIVVGAGSLFILKKLGYLDIRPIQEAFRREWLWIGLVVLSLAGLLWLSAVRFHLLVRGLGLKAPFREVLASNLVGQAVGQWLPGSLAMTEILRFGVMAGLKTGSKSRLGLAIIVDRLLGLGAMFAVGGLAGFALFLAKGAAPKHALAVVLLSAGSLILGLAALAAPFRPNRLLVRIASRSAGDKDNRNGVVRKTAGKSLELLEALGELRSHGAPVSRVLLLSLSAAILNPLTLYFSARAAGHPLPILVILASIPFTVAAVFLPAGIAGFGGPQLLAAGVFPIFGADPGIVVTACLLQNTIVLAGQTIGGALGLALISDRSALRPGKKEST